MNLLSKLLQPYILLLSSPRKYSTWTIISALARLAVLKRIYREKKDIKFRMGKFLLYAPDYATLSYLIKEKFVDEEYKFEAGHDRPVIIDGGSHIGISVVYFKSIYPNAIIYCYEPSEQMFFYLDKNVRANNLQQVFLSNIALGTSSDTSSLFLPVNGLNFNYTLLQQEGQPGVSVAVNPLSSIIADLPVVDLLKLDVEGYELELIRHLHDLQMLSVDRIKSMIIEYHGSVFGNASILDSFVDLLKKRGYKLSVKTKYNDKLIRAAS